MIEPFECLVRKIENISENIFEIDIVPVDRGKFVSNVTPGEHVTVEFGNKIRRTYSLVNATGPVDCYRFAVKHSANDLVNFDLNIDAPGSGSRFIKEKLKKGDLIRILDVRNNFKFKLPTKFALFLAGGIGITPLFAMAQAASNLSIPWKMLYSVKSKSSAVYFEKLKSLSCGKVFLHSDEENGGYADFRKWLSATDESTDIYCCGPSTMMNQVRDDALLLGKYEYINFEYFSSPISEIDKGINNEGFEIRNSGDSPSNGFVVKLNRSDKVLTVPPNKSLLEVLEESGIDCLSSCRMGVCGTCEIKVISGSIIHKDYVLSDKEKSSNKSIMACVSRANSSYGDPLVLDI